MSWAFLATKGQSAAVVAQYMLSGQQNQLASGQQPAGQEVSSGPHCLFLAIFMSWAFLATKGQSAAVAAQYMLSGQQNQLASGQQPAGQEVSSGPHCLFLAIFMSWPSWQRRDSQQRWQHSTCCQGSRTSWPQGSSQRGKGLIRSTLPVLGHLYELGLLGNEGTVGSGGSTVHVVGAAEPVGLRAAASRARGLIRSTLTVIELHFHSMGKCHKGKDGH